MSHLLDSHSDRRQRARTASPRTLLTLGLAASTLFLTACGGRGPKTLQTVDQDVSQLGTQNLKPGATDEYYVIDSHGGGQKQGLRMVQLYWGRLVQVEDLTGTVVYRDFVVNPDLFPTGTFTIQFQGQGETVDYQLRQNPVTGQETLVLQVENDPGGTPDPADRFDLALAEAENGVVDIAFNPVTAIGTQTRIARNCAIVVQFDDLLDEDSIVLNDTVKILTGNPPTVAFDARVFADPNHGGVDPVSGQFQSTRLIVDTTVSSFELGGDVGTLPLNSLGLPAATTNDQANVALLFPTTISPSDGQFQRLTNLAGKALSTSGNGPIAAAPTQDVVRAMRTGSALDVNNGFLFDLQLPRLVAAQNVTVTNAVEPLGLLPTDPEYGYRWLVDMTFATAFCAVDPQEGDVVQVSNSIFAVVETDNVNVGADVIGLEVLIPRDESLLPEASPTFDPTDPADVYAFFQNELIGSGVFQFPWRPAEMAAQSACFASFSPPAGSPPALQVPNDAQISLRFSEPMDPASFGAFSSFRVTRRPPSANPRAYEHVVGAIAFSPDLREFRFQPLLPLSNVSQNPGGDGDSNPQRYHLTLTSTVDGGLRDLAGNRLESVFSTVNFDVSNASTVATGGYVFRFEDPNLDETGDGKADTRGQFIQDQANGRLLPRGVSRFSRVIDATQPVVALMNVPQVVGVQTPLSNLGSRLHAMWRYSDMGLTIDRQDGTFTDLDVEFTYLNPVGGQIVAAFYPEFFMGLSHACCHPDEYNDVLSGFPQFPTSGFSNNSSYAETYLPLAGQTPFPVHPREKGFEVANTELFTSETGLPLLRMPLNRGLDQGDRVTWTWRDTSVTTRGALSPNGQTKGPGVPTRNESENLGLPDCWGAVWGGGNDKGVPTSGLPLMIEYRTYPTETLALINFGIAISNGSSRNPFHRAFSTGGYNTQGAAVVKNPDLETSPTGGFQGNPQAQQPLGSPTPGLDNTVYFGQVDFVVRYSRAHTIPVDANGNPDPNYVAIVIEPSASAQPLGTRVNVDYRGHDTPISAASPMTDAINIDVYGDQSPPPPGLTNFNGNTCVSTGFNAFVFDSPNWTPNLDAMDGNRYVQHRFTFINNVESGLAPILDSFGVAYTF